MQSSSRNGAKVIWLAVHTTEGMMRAKDLRDWKSWAGSSHASNDETGVLMTPADGFVPYDRAAWTLRNGNAISDNLEQCGFAKWTRADWLARPKLLDTTALWLADRSRARGIPLVRLSAADIRAKRPGVIGHGDYSQATGDGTHWDPGPGYPWDVVLAKARWLLNPTPLPEDDDMPLTDDDVQRVARAVVDRQVSGDREVWRVLAALDSRDPNVNPVAQAVVDRTVVGDLTLWQALQQQAGLLQAVASRDATQIAAAVPADLAKQVADELVARLKA